MMSNFSYSDDEEYEIQNQEETCTSPVRGSLWWLIGGVFLFLVWLLVVCFQPKEVSVSEPEYIKPDRPPVVLQPQEITLPEKPKTDWIFGDDTAELDMLFPSEFVLLVNMDSREVLACKNPEERMNPASMTKILTLLVAVENIRNISETVTITSDIIEYCKKYGCSVAGYRAGEKIPVDELFYGCILSSGADASLALARAAAGSHTAFVELLNGKLEELGLSESAHFTNCVGLYNSEHYCTVKDMARILEAALNNEKCRKVLSAQVYRNKSRELSNWFLHRTQEVDTPGMEVRYGKTGYVRQAGYCAASGAVAEDGTTYLCITGNSTSIWQATYDHTTLYQQYCG